MLLSSDRRCIHRAIRLNLFATRWPARLAAALMVLSTALVGSMQAWSEAANPQVRLTTTMGNIDLELDPVKAPKTVENFLKRVDEGFYSGLIFHRVIAGFMIQGGGYQPKMNYREPPETVVNESANGLRNYKGSIAMARRNDPDSASTQFFINVTHNPSLDGGLGRPGYTVFGKVIAGMDVVVAIELTETHSFAGMTDVPVEDVIIKSATRIN